jgi:solute carrier family 25 carnitine/acylcarnitine transporter 20/29
MGDDVWPRVRRFIAGYASGAALVLAGHPFDTIKVRMQSEGRQGRFSGVLDCVTKTVRGEGMLALYKGMAAPLFATGIINSVLFGTQFNLVSELVRRRTDAGDAGPPRVTEVMSAAVVSGAFISLLVTPMEGVKARLQVQYSAGAAKYSGPLDCFVKVYKSLGVTRGLYRGWTAVCLCRMSNWSYFGSYAYISSALSGSTPGPLPFSASVIAGAASGLCYWLSCYPIDVVKNRIQAAPDLAVPVYKNMRDAFRHVYRVDGVRGFFVGFSAAAVRSLPANAAAFTAFEFAMRLLPSQW